jgi:hypothetical protein
MDGRRSLPAISTVIIDQGQIALWGGSRKNERYKMQKSLMTSSASQAQQRIALCADICGNNSSIAPSENHSLIAARS